MGLTQSNGGGDDQEKDALLRFYQVQYNFVHNPYVMSYEGDEIQNVRPPVSGGGELKTAIDGFDGIANYENSVYSKAKEKLIQTIAKSVFEAMGVKASADKMSTDALIAGLKKVTPGKTKQLGKSFDSKKQRETCIIFANAINDAYGSVVVDVNGTTEGICESVMEVMGSLYTGLHSEFFGVLMSLNRVVKNLKVLGETLDMGFAKAIEKLRSSGNSQLVGQATAMADLYRMVKSEHNRQMNILQNLLNVNASPANKSVIEALDDEDQFPALVLSLRNKYGKQEVREKIAGLLSGVTSVATLAGRVNEALKILGMTRDEFMNVNTVAALRSLIYTKIKDSSSSTDIEKLLNAAQLLTNGSYPKSEVDALLRTIKGGNFMQDLEVGGSNTGQNIGGDGDMYDTVLGDDPENDVETATDGVYGGLDEDSTYMRQKKMTHKLDAMIKFREAVFLDFKARLSEQYREIVNCIAKITANVGEIVPVTEELRTFNNMFKELRDPTVDVVYRYLTNYYKTDTSEFQRNSFIDTIKHLIEAAKAVPKNQLSSEFTRLISMLNGLLKEVDSFTDILTNRLTNLNVKPTDTNLRRIVFGGGLQQPEIKLPHGYSEGSAVPLARAQLDLDYYINIEMVKKNLYAMSSELKKDDSYVNTLGEEAAFMISKIRTSTNDFIQHINSNDSTANFTAMTNNNCNGQMARNTLIGLAKLQAEAKEDVIMVAQSIDLYMKNFTAGITLDPEKLRDLVATLDSVQIVARWFTERSGDHLATLFECFPVKMVHTAGVGATADYHGEAPVNTAATYAQRAAPTISTDSSTFNGEHYYTSVTQRKNAGNPFIGIDLTKVNKETIEKIMQLSEKSIKSMHALENILLMFVSIASKFPSNDINASALLSPGEIYNKLCNYVKVSAFTYGFNVANGGAALDLRFGTGGARCIYPTLSNRQQYAGQAIPNVVQADVTAPANLNAPTAAEIIDAHPNITEVAKKFNSGDTANIPNGTEFGFEVGCTFFNGWNRVAGLAMSAVPAIDPNNFWPYHEATGVRRDAAGYIDHFADTDHLFIMLVKAIVAKIFTAVDAYRLFNRPSIDRSKSSVAAPIRTILGAGEKSEVPIIDEAVELYYRLPLLAEWYRGHFGYKTHARYDNDAEATQYKWSMAPSLNGVWTQLIAIVFDEVHYLDKGTYTEEQAQRLIKSINDIWTKYKASGKSITPQYILNAFVMEMNQTAGFMKRLELKKYEESRRLNVNPPAGDEEELGPDLIHAREISFKKAMPSDSFTTAALTNLIAERRSQIVQLMGEVSRIRAEIDDQFRKYASDKSTQNLIANIRSTMSNLKEEIKHAKSPVDKYNLVLAAVQGYNHSVLLDVDKVIMVHETVRAPLLALYSAYSLLDRANCFMHGTAIKNLAEIRTTVAYDPALVRPVPAPLPAAPFMSQFVADYVAALGRKYPHASVEERTKIARYVVGVNKHTESTTRISHSMYLLRLNELGPGANLTMANVNVRFIMHDIMLMIMDFSSNSLVNCSVGDNGFINISVDKLRKLIKSLLENVRSNLFKLKMALKPNLLKKYNDVANPGSVEWLKLHFDEILENKNGCGLSVALTECLNETLREITNQVTYVETNPLTNFTGGDFTPAVYNVVCNIAGIGSNIQVPILRTRRQQYPYGWDYSIYPFNLFPDPKLSDEDKRILLELNMDGQISPNTLTAMHDIRTSMTAIMSATHRTYGIMCPDDVNKSLVFVFNKIYETYLKANFDEVQEKLYLPAIEKFTNGTVATELTSKTCAPNIAAEIDSAAFHGLVGGAYGPNSVFIPSAHALLFASNAMITNKIIGTRISVGNLQKKKYLYETIADIADNHKQRMKDVLPYFMKLLDDFSSRCAIIATFISKLKLSDFTPPTLLSGKLGEYTQVGLDPKALTAEEFKSHLIFVTNRLNKMAKELRASAASAYNELADKMGYFGEVTPGSLQDYKNTYGCLPLIPASIAVLPLFGNIADTGDAFFNPRVSKTFVGLPSTEVGSAVYQYNTATKVLFTGKLELALTQFPTVLDIYNSYSVKTSTNKISTAEYGDTMLNMLTLIRGLSEGVTLSRLYAPERHTTYTTNGFQGAAIPGFNGQFTPYKTGLNSGSLFCNMFTDYAFDKSPMQPSDYNVMSSSSMLESTLGLFDNRPEVGKKQIADSTQMNTDEVQAESRDTWRIANILDANIVPLNVHSFMREVAFVNILNYSYTLDRMLESLLLPPNTKFNPNATAVNTSQMLCKLLQHPHAMITSSEEYFYLLPSIMNGNDTIGLGRPKYIADQVAGKSLFISAFQNWNTTNQLEGGPTAYDVVRRFMHERKRNVFTMAERNNLSMNLRAGNVVYSACRVGDLRNGNNVYDGVESFIPNFPKFDPPLQAANNFPLPYAMAATRGIFEPLYIVLSDLFLRSRFDIGTVTYNPPNNEIVSVNPVSMFIAHETPALHTEIRIADDSIDLNDERILNALVRHAFARSTKPHEIEFSNHPDIVKFKEFFDTKGPVPAFNANVGNNLLGILQRMELDHISSLATPNAMHTNFSTTLGLEVNNTRPGFTTGKRLETLLTAVAAHKYENINVANTNNFALFGGPAVLARGQLSGSPRLRGNLLTLSLNPTPSLINTDLRDDFISSYVKDIKERFISYGIDPARCEDYANHLTRNFKVIYNNAFVNCNLSAFVIPYVLYSDPDDVCELPIDISGVNYTNAGFNHDVDHMLNLLYPSGNYCLPRAAKDETNDMYSFLCTDHYTKNMLLSVQGISKYISSQYIANRNGNSFSASLSTNATTICVADIISVSVSGMRYDDIVNNHAVMINGQNVVTNGNAPANVSTDDVALVSQIHSWVIRTYLGGMPVDPNQPPTTQDIAAINEHIWNVPAINQTFFTQLDDTSPIDYIERNLKANLSPLYAYMTTLPNATPNPAQTHDSARYLASNAASIAIKNPANMFKTINSINVAENYANLSQNALASAYAAYILMRCFALPIPESECVAKIILLALTKSNTGTPLADGKNTIQLIGEAIDGKQIKSRVLNLIAKTVVDPAGSITAFSHNYAISPNNPLYVMNNASVRAIIIANALSTHLQNHPTIIEFQTSIMAPQNSNVAVEAANDDATQYQISSGLKYYDTKQNKWVVAGETPMEVTFQLSELGKLRFDTKLVRTLLWFAQLQRIMRKCLLTHLNWMVYNDVVSGIAITDRTITEYTGDEAYSAEATGTA